MSFTQVTSNKYSHYGISHVLIDTNTKFNHVRMRLDSSFNTSNASDIIKTIQFSTSSTTPIPENTWSTCDNIDLSASNPSAPTHGDTLFFDISAVSLLTDYIYVRPVYKTQQTIGYDISYVVDLKNYMMKQPEVEKIEVYDCSKNQFGSPSDLSFVLLTKDKNKNITTTDNEWKTNIGETDVSNVILRYTFKNTENTWNALGDQNVIVDASFGHSEKPNITMTAGKVSNKEIDISSNSTDLTGSGNISFNLRMKRGTTGSTYDVSQQSMTTFKIPRTKVFDIPYDLSWNSEKLDITDTTDKDYIINLSGGTMVDMKDVSAVYYSTDATDNATGTYNRFVDASVNLGTMNQVTLKMKGSSILEGANSLWLQLWYNKIMNQEYYIKKNMKNFINIPSRGFHLPTNFPNATLGGVSIADSFAQTDDGWGIKWINPSILSPSNVPGDPTYPGVVVGFMLKHIFETDSTVIVSMHQRSACKITLVIGQTIDVADFSGVTAVGNFGGSSQTLDDAARSGFVTTKIENYDSSQDVRTLTNNAGENYKYSYMVLGNNTQHGSDSLNTSASYYMGSTGHTDYFAPLDAGWIGTLGYFGLAGSKFPSGTDANTNGVKTYFKIERRTVNGNPQIVINQSSHKTQGYRHHEYITNLTKLQSGDKFAILINCYLTAANAPITQFMRVENSLTEDNTSTLPYYAFTMANFQSVSAGNYYIGSSTSSSSSVVTFIDDHVKIEKDPNETSPIITGAPGNTRTRGTVLYSSLSTNYNVHSLHGQGNTYCTLRILYTYAWKPTKLIIGGNTHGGTGNITIRSYSDHTFSTELSSYPISGITWSPPLTTDSNIRYNTNILTFDVGYANYFSIYAQWPNNWCWCNLAVS